MGVAYAVKKGDMQLSDVDAEYRDEVKGLVDGMSLKKLKDFAATKHDDLPEHVGENVTPAMITGMGPVELPADGLLGSGDVPAGRGDAEEEYKKKKKKMRHIHNFESFVNESLLNEAKRINQKQAGDYLKKLKKQVTSIIKAKAAKINGEVRLYVDYSNFKERAALKRAGEDLGLTYHSDGRSTNAPTLDFKRGDAIVGTGGVLGISKNWMAFTKE